MGLHPLTCKRSLRVVDDAIVKGELYTCKTTPHTGRYNHIWCCLNKECLCTGEDFHPQEKPFGALSSLVVLSKLKLFFASFIEFTMIVIWSMFT